MNAINDHFFALKLSVLQLAKGKIWLYIIPPVAVALFFYSIFAFFHNISEGAEVAKKLPWVGEYVTTGVQKTIGFMVWITDEFYKFFILTLLSPINCLLSEKVDNEVTGAKFDGGFVRVMKDWSKGWILGIIRPKKYFDTATFYKKGTTDYSNGMTFKADSWNLEISKLLDFKKLLNSIH